MTYSTLSPIGIYHKPPDQARNYQDIQTQLIQTYQDAGFGLIEPPMLTTTAHDQAFRVFDPLSNQTLFLRVDMTRQIMAIAQNLRENSKPLRLCYDGPVFRAKGREINPARQLQQTGFEYIGIEDFLNLTEVIELALKSLSKIGLKDFVIDLHYPKLIEIVLDNPTIYQNPEFRHAVNEKDFNRIQKILDKDHPLLENLLKQCGSAHQVKQNLQGIELSTSKKNHLMQFIKLIESIETISTDEFNIDLSEWRGFSYYTGPTFSIFAKSAKCEIGRGGVYNLDDGTMGAGFSLYIDNFVGEIKK